MKNKSKFNQMLELLESRLVYSFQKEDWNHNLSENKNLLLRLFVEIGDYRLKEWIIKFERSQLNTYTNESNKLFFTVHKLREKCIEEKVLNKY